MKIKNLEISKKVLACVGIFFVLAVSAILTRALIKTPAKCSGGGLTSEQFVYIPKIAIILDDWGYNANGCTFLEKIDIPITVSILPELRYSQTIARCAHQNNKEVMLHLPLEPHKFFETYPEDYVILSSMTKDKILAMLDKFFKNIPFVVGANNHMGSKASEDRALMKIVFSYFRKNNFFFVDSLVSSNSICEPLAQEEHVPFLHRNVFLDHEADAQYIKGQLDQLAERAKKQGFALGIGHDRPLTKEILLEQSQKLKNQGFKFVTVKELIYYAQEK